MSQGKNNANDRNGSTIGEKLAIVLGACAEALSDDAAEELGRGIAVLIKRIAWAAQGSFTPEAGMFDTLMLAAFQNRDPENVRRWCEEREVTLRKTGRPNSYKGADIIEAARGADDGEGTSGKK